MRTVGGDRRVRLGKARTLTLFFQSTPYFYEGVLSQGPSSVRTVGGDRRVRLGKAHTLTLFFQSTPYFYEGYFCRVLLACVRLAKVTL
jgi:hypothetical protein